MRGNVVFFIDSFDELSNIGQKNVLEMLKTLRQCPSFKFLVATRVHAKVSLEETLCTSAYKFIPLDRSQQLQFLLKRWNLHLQNKHRFSNFCLQWDVHKKTLETFVNQVLDHVEGVIGKGDTFIGIPIQLVLLEQVQRSGFENFCQDLQNDEQKDCKTYIFHFESKLALYDEFVTKKIDCYILEKNVQRPTEFYLGGNRNPYEIHYAAAMMYFKGSMFQNNCEIDVKDLDESEIEKVNRTGICEIISSVNGSRSYRFVHETLAEYFAAKYLVNDLKVKKDVVINFLKVHYCEPYFRKVRLFLDSILFDACKISSISCLDKLQRTIDEEEYLSGKEMNENEPAPQDALGRTLLHYAAAYGCIDDETLWKVVLNKKNLFISMEDALGATCFSYTILSESFKIFRKADKLDSHSAEAFLCNIMLIASLPTEPMNRYIEHLQTLGSVRYTPRLNWSVCHYINSQPVDKVESVLDRRFPDEWIWLALANVFVVPFKCNMQWLVSNASYYLHCYTLWLFMPYKEESVKPFFGLFKNCKFNVQTPNPQLLNTIIQICSRPLLVMIKAEQIYELWVGFTDFQRVLMIGWLDKKRYWPFLKGDGLTQLPLFKMVIQVMQPLYGTFCPLTVFLGCMFHVGVKYCNEKLCNDVRVFLKEADKDVALKEVWIWNFTKISNKRADGVNDYRNACLQTIFNGKSTTWRLKKEKDIPARSYRDSLGIILPLEFTRDHEAFHAGLLQRLDDDLKSSKKYFSKYRII